MIPNKTEEQIFYQQFKFFDLDSSGYCTLQNFIKTNDRLGVVLPKLEHFEVVFNYFADPDSSLLNYRKFIHQIFNFKNSKEGVQPPEKGEEMAEKDFITILTDKLIKRGGTFPLVELIKNLQMIDFEGNKRINIDNFMKALQRCKIFLNTNEMQTLFNEFDFFENGIVKYEILINILLEQFWDDEKTYLSEQIYYLLTGNGRKSSSLNALKDYFDQILMDTLEKKFFLEFVKEYKTINKSNVSQSMNLKELIRFLKFYNFGQNNNNYLNDLINILKDEEEKEKYNRNKMSQNESRFKKLKQAQKQAELEGKKINNYLGEGYENPRINEIHAKLRERLICFGRKTLFNFLKHFKFYDNKTKYISKYDFSKILQNFNIKLSVDDIDEIFKNYGIDKIHNTMNYELFLNDLILGYNSKERQDVINYIFDTILERGENLLRDIDLNFLKDIYNPTNNYFNKDMNENKIEFEECLELYHYNYGGFKKEKVTKREFCFFYYFISLLIPSDDDFFYMIANEWRVPLDNLYNIDPDKSNNNEYIKNNLEENIKRNFTNMSRYAQLGEKSKDYQGNMYTAPKNDFGNDKDNYNTNPYPEKSKYPLKKEDFEDKGNYYNNTNNINKNKDFYSKEEKNDPLSLLTEKLSKRGLRGILYLYSQFLSYCPNVNKITFNDFITVFKIQHIELDNKTLKKIFDSYIKKSNNNNYDDGPYLDFYSFIRTYKKELNENKLNSVEQAFSNIDERGENRVPLDVVKMKYNAKKHPDVLNGKYSEDEKIMEFLDCFDICYNILEIDNKENKHENGEYVDFEIFANFYEYVSFIYPRDRDFQYVINATWL